jgi:hypothetical protein
MTTREQAGALADLARLIRPAWDTRAITDAIAEVRHRELREIAWALITVALDPQFRTPKALTFEGDHWRAPAISNKPRPFTREPTPQVTDKAQDYIQQAAAAVAQARAAWQARNQEESA